MRCAQRSRVLIAGVEGLCGKDAGHDPPHVYVNGGTVTWWGPWGPRETRGFDLTGVVLLPGEAAIEPL